MCVLKESEMMLLSQVSLEKTIQETSLIVMPRGGDCGQTHAQMCMYLDAMGNFNSHINH